MSFSFLRKAFGITKPIESKEYNDFLRVFESYESNHNDCLNKLLKKKAVRLLVITSGGSAVVYDSFITKHSVKSLPVFTVGSQQISIVDMAFGSYSLNDRKPVLYLTKHDLGRNGVCVCLLLNWECFFSQHNGKPQTANNVSRINIPSLLNNECKNGFSDNFSKRIYHTLFEHCLQFSIMVETLHNEVLVSLLNVDRSNWNKFNLDNGLDLINKAFNGFLDSYKNLLLTKMAFPVWSTLNNTLSLTQDFFPINIDHIDYLSSLFTMNQTSNSSVSNFYSPYDNLTDIFVRSCLDPLIVKSKGKESRSFLCRILTGVLMFHTGWIQSVLCDEFIDQSFSNSPLKTAKLSDQLLSQAGSVASNLEALAGSIFNCTVISGQSRQYMLILLYFTTYFLRFICMTCSRECVPELGQADLFELEQQKRRTRLGGKPRRKSSSVINTFTNCGEANDSGISSQEDLTNVVYSASMGSSPTHISGMALCMARRLTRDQCRIAEAAAQLTVNREVAAATSSSSNDNMSHHKPGTSDFSSNNFDGNSNYLHSNRMQYTEVPLLIEKSVDEEEELCSCLFSEIFPGCTLPCPKQSFSLKNKPDSNFNQHRHGDSSRLPDDPLTSSISNQSTNRPFFSNEPLSALFTNHCLIGSTVLDTYHGEHVLQATFENFESLKPRLEHNLIQWLVYGPLVLRGANLSNNLTLCDPKLLDHIKHRRWRATGLLINSDSKSVEALTLIQPSPSELTMYKQLRGTSTTHSQRGDTRTPSKNQRHHTSDQTSSIILSPLNALKNSVSKRVIPVKGSPLVARLIEQIHLVLTSTNCPVLTLKHLESNLQIIYQKSSILKDLIIKEGPNVLKQPNRIVCVTGCSLDDLPLLLSIASACSIQLTNLLQDFQMDWWDF